MKPLERIKRIAIAAASLPFHTISGITLVIALVFLIPRTYELWMKSWEASSAEPIDFSPVWNRIHNGENEFFFEVTYQYEANDKPTVFKMEHSFTAEDVAKNQRSKEMSNTFPVWYKTSNPNKIDFENPEAKKTSQYKLKYGAIYFLSIAICIALLFYLGKLFLKYYALEIAPKEHLATEKSGFKYASPLITVEDWTSRVVTFGILITFAVYIFGSFNDHTFFVNAFISLSLLCVYLVASVTINYRKGNQVLNELHGYLEDKTTDFWNRIPKSLEEHFTVKGTSNRNSGSMPVDAYGAAIFLIVFLYLPFVIIPSTVFLTLRAAFTSFLFLLNWGVTRPINYLFRNLDLKTNQAAGFAYAFSYAFLVTGGILLIVYMMD